MSRGEFLDFEHCVRHRRGCDGVGLFQARARCSTAVPTMPARPAISASGIAAKQTERGGQTDQPAYAEERHSCRACPDAEEVEPFRRAVQGAVVVAAPHVCIGSGIDDAEQAEK